MKRRHIFRLLIALPLTCLLSISAHALLPILLRVFLSGMVRAGSRSAAKRLVSRGVSSSAASRPVVRSGASVARTNPQAPRGKNKKLPAALQLVVEEAVSQIVSTSVASSYDVPKSAPICIVGEKRISFEIYAENQSSVGQPFELNFYLYDIDAREVESVIQGPFGYLQPDDRIESILYIPEMLYPGRKVLVTNQDNTDTRTSDVFYAMEK